MPYVHDIDPFIFQLPGGWGPRWYGFSYLLGFLIGYLLCRRVVRVGRSSMTVRQVGDFIVTVAIGILLGGRLGYVLFYRPDMLWSFESTLPFWDVLAINKGGMASHGGILGGGIACIWYSLRQRIHLLFLFDLFAFGAPLGLFFGRVANFVNGELYGRPAPVDHPLAVRFPQELLADPGMAQTAIDRLLAADILVRGREPVLWIIDQIQAGSDAVSQVVAPLLTPRYPSQLFAAVLEGLVVAAVLLIAWQRPRKPGTIGALFLITYGLMRIVNELWRQPDEHLGFQWLGLTRGQWLSVPLVIGGIAGLLIVTRLPTPKLGGWREVSRRS